MKAEIDNHTVAVEQVNLIRALNRACLSCKTCRAVDIVNWHLPLHPVVSDNAFIGYISTVPVPFVSSTRVLTKSSTILHINIAEVAARRYVSHAFTSRSPEEIVLRND